MRGFWMLVIVPVAFDVIACGSGDDCTETEHEDFDGVWSGSWADEEGGCNDMVADITGSLEIEQQGRDVVVMGDFGEGPATGTVCGNHLSAGLRETENRPGCDWHHETRVSCDLVRDTLHCSWFYETRTVGVDCTVSLNCSDRWTITAGRL